MVTQPVRRALVWCAWDMSQGRIDPPDCLADLVGQVCGAELAVYAADVHDCPYRVSLGPPAGEASEGLFVDPERQFGIDHGGVAWVTYRDGRSQCGDAWDDQQEDDIGEAMGFVDWVRWRVRELIAERAGTQVLALWACLPDLDADGRADAQAQMADLLRHANHAQRIEQGWVADARGLSCLLALIDDGGGDEARDTLQACIPLLSGFVIEPESPFGTLARTGMVLLGSAVSRQLVHPTCERARSEARSVLDGLQHGMAVSQFGAYRRAYEACAPIVRDACMAVFDEAGKASVAEAEDGSEREVQEWINRYNDLSREFAAGRPVPQGADARADELIGLEKRLNTWWRDCHPDSLDARVEEGRFLSSGSAGYVAWLRNRRRYEAAIAYVREHVADPELCSLRHRSHPGAFESLVANGLGSFLDSGDEGHIAQAVEVVDRLESAVDLAGGDALYQVACVLARAGLRQRALTAVERALAAGESVRDMVSDPDLSAVRTELLRRAQASE